MIWPTIVLQNIQGFIALRMITPCGGYLQKKYLDILTYPTCKFQSVKTSRVSNHLRIPILVLKVGITKFLYLEYKTTNNPSIKETQMQPLFFVYIFVVRTQKSHIKGNYENRLACWQVIQVAYRMFIRFTSLLVFIHVPDTILTNTCCCT